MTLHEFLYEHNLEMIYDLIYRHGVRHGFFDDDGKKQKLIDNDDVEVVTDPRGLLDF